MSKKPYIENVSLYNVIKGRHHFDRDAKTVLIQIVDPDRDYPTPAHDFDKVIQMKFYDVDIDNTETDLFCTEEHAKILVKTLQDALAEGANVTVHCTAGICRSGAVTEVGLMMGFEAVHHRRQPNSLVKRRMMKELGWTYE